MTKKMYDATVSFSTKTH